MMTGHLNNLAFAHTHAAVIPIGLGLDVALLIGILIVLVVLNAFFSR